MKLNKNKPPVLEVENLIKHFPVRKKRPVKAVDGISFQMEEGEVLGLLGPNGAGKTTTIQMLLSVLKPTSGEIRYFGKDFSKHRSEILKEVAFASTYVNFPWRLRVWENLDVYARLYGMDKKTRERRIQKMLAMFQISDQRDKIMTELSAGQTTRVMISKAFLCHPKVVLLDEPTASLDPEIAVTVREFIKKQRQEYGVSILFTSHNMSEVTELCDRVMFLQKGKIVAADKPEVLASQVKETRLELNVGDGLKRTIEVCKAEQLAYKVKGRKIEIVLLEKEIAKFLNKLAAKKVDYKQITVVKPTLEDYFLQIAKQQKND